ncbi:MAG TPA: thioredoxin-disulfide reductase, partial [Methylomirabilota bacterium]
MATTRKVVIIGSGPAGFTAAIYAARANLAPVMFTGVHWGGQLMLTTLVENYPGFVDGIDGPPLMEHLKGQAKRFGTEMVGDDVTEVDLSRRPFRVTAGDTTVEALTVIIATGASAKLIGLANESKLMGRGVSTCATCDGFFFKDQNIMVVGGGDSAMEEALYLSRLGRQVQVVHRRDALRASKIMQERALKNPKIEFIWDTAVDEVLDPDKGKVTSVRLKNLKSGVVWETPVDGLFVAIGHLPNTAIFKGQVDLHPNDYIKVSPGTTQTSVPGVFAAGDVADFTYRQAVTAAGTGCMAA